jgi:hypothetical protein
VSQLRAIEKTLQINKFRPAACRLGLDVYITDTFLVIVKRHEWLANLAIQRFAFELADNDLTRS